MGRYIGPKSKIARKFGEAIFGTDKSLEKKNYPPGQHGLMRKRKKVSEYGTQLLEKQKAKAIYGIQEKQFRRTFEEAARVGGITGENLLRILECRLDNVVYRLGIAPTRAAARPQPLLVARVGRQPDERQVPAEARPGRYSRKYQRAAYRRVVF